MSEAIEAPAATAANMFDSDMDGLDLNFESGGDLDNLLNDNLLDDNAFMNDSELHKMIQNDIAMDSNTGIHDDDPIPLGQEQQQQANSVDPVPLPEPEPIPESIPVMTPGYGNQMVGDVSINLHDSKAMFSDPLLGPSSGQPGDDSTDSFQNLIADVFEGGGSVFNRPSSSQNNRNIPNHNNHHHNNNNGMMTIDEQAHLRQQLQRHADANANGMSVHQQQQQQQQQQHQIQHPTVLMMQRQQQQQQQRQPQNGMNQNNFHFQQQQQQQQQNLQQQNFHQQQNGSNETPLQSYLRRQPQGSVPSVPKSSGESSIQSFLRNNRKSMHTDAAGAPSNSPMASLLHGSSPALTAGAASVFSADGGMGSNNNNMLMNGMDRSAMTASMLSQAMAKKPSGTGLNGKVDLLDFRRSGIRRKIASEGVLHGRNAFGSNNASAEGSKNATWNLGNGGSLSNENAAYASGMIRRPTSRQNLKSLSGMRSKASLSPVPSRESSLRNLLDGHTSKTPIRRAHNLTKHRLGAKARSTSDFLDSLRSIQYDG